MNIVWKKPDGSIAVTTMTPQALDAIAFVSDKAIVDLVGQREEVEASLEDASGDKDESVVEALREFQARIALHDDIHLRIGGSLERHAEILKEQGGVPADWEAVAFAYDLPDSGRWINAWVWNDGRVEVDMERARIHAAEVAKQYADVKISGLAHDASVAMAIGDDEALTNCRSSISDIRKALVDLPLASAESPADLDALISRFS